MELTLADLEQLRTQALAAFQTRVASIPADQSERYVHEAARFVGQVEALNRIVVLVLGRKTDRATAYAVWDAMVQICDSCLAKLAEIQPRHPGTSAWSSKILDIRLSADRRRESYRIQPETPR